jgi:hypothetical protein
MQKRFHESGAPREMFVGGRSGGRRAAIESVIRFNACSAEEAQLCIDDLNRTGFALQSSDGKRVKPSPSNGARFRYMRFDEEKQ